MASAVSAFGRPQPIGKLQTYPGSCATSTSYAERLAEGLTLTTRLPEPESPWMIPSPRQQVPAAAASYSPAAGSFIKASSDAPLTFRLERPSAPGTRIITAPEADAQPGLQATAQLITVNRAGNERLLEVTAARKSSSSQSLGAPVVQQHSAPPTGRMVSHSHQFCKEANASATLQRCKLLSSFDDHQIAGSS